MVTAGDESRDVAIASAATPQVSDPTAAIQQLVGGVRVQRTASGGLIIEAPPETASTLAALFSGMAQLFQAATALPVTGGDPVGSRVREPGSSGGDRRSDRRPPSVGASNS